MGNVGSEAGWKWGEERAGRRAAARACFNGPLSTRMKPMFEYPSSDWMSDASSRYLAMSVSNAVSARFALAYLRMNASLSTSQMCLYRSHELRYFCSRGRISRMPVITCTSTLRMSSSLAICV